MLNKEETNRYTRQILLPEIRLEGQEKLKHSKVLVIGAGGLGCPVIQFLSAAGIGTIGILDFDVVEISNLQRQTLYGVEDLHKLKVDCAESYVNRTNPNVTVNKYPIKIETKNAFETIRNYDMVVDCTDNFAARYLIGDATYILSKPLVYGSIYRFEGQVTVFNLNMKENDKAPNYRCLFPNPPSPEEAPDCAAAGVLGAVTGIIGNLMAMECIKIITGAGKVLSGELLLMNALNMDFTKVVYTCNETTSKGPKNEQEFLTFDYPSFCKLPQTNNNISAETLSEWLLQKEDIQLLDVREINEEPESINASDIKIPLADLTKNVMKLKKDKKLIVYCKAGSRSVKAIATLEKEFGFTNVYNLEGGILSWLSKSTKK